MQTTQFLEDILSNSNPALTKEQYAPLIDAIKTDINSIVSEGYTPDDLGGHLEMLLDLAKLAKKSGDTSVQKHTRFFLLVIENRIRSWPGDQSTTNKLLPEIAGLVGRVPKLNPGEIRLPEDKYLSNKDVREKESYRKEVWKKPFRQRPSGKSEQRSMNSAASSAAASSSEGTEKRKGKEKLEKVEFYTSTGHIAVREHLTAHDLHDRNKEGSDGQAFCHATQSLQSCSSLDADHMLPSKLILERQIELLEAMNLDPIHAENTMETEEAKRYLICEDGTFYGSRGFFMEYHNCIDNIWFIKAELNKEKRDQDPVSWLTTQPQFGKDLFAQIGEVNTDYILYTGAQDKILGKLVRQWSRRERYPTRLLSDILQHQTPPGQATPADLEGTSTYAAIGLALSVCAADPEETSEERGLEVAEQTLQERTDQLEQPTAETSGSDEEEKPARKKHREEVRNQIATGANIAKGVLPNVVRVVEDARNASRASTKKNETETGTNTFTYGENP
ncbi:MAG: hypothetical protein DHS20C10_11950 [marine bacterium B5-7]|nr:MAG: hypothetical protein DHS20C10_11950 [marine bacterium B5-7]